MLVGVSEGGMPLEGEVAVPAEVCGAQIHLVLLGVASLRQEGVGLVADSAVEGVIQAEVRAARLRIALA